MGVRQAAAQDGDERRNVILILSDDHRYDFMGFHERAPAFLETPNMDRMRRGGAHVRNAFVTTALCSPSRASILTGRYAHQHGVVDNSTPEPEGTVFFPAYLQDAGYETAFIGKWHMGAVHDDPRPGFDYWISYRGQGTYYDPVLNINGETVEREGYTADIVTDYALEWLDEHKDEPFFLYLSHKSVHAEFEPAERHLNRYADVELTYPPTFANTEENYAGKPDWVREQRNSWHGVDYMYHGQFDFDTFYRRYTETLLGLDDNIGRVLDYVEQNGLAENTLVIYMSDNGFSFGEHGLIDKRHMYEESMRVPMLVYAPGLVEAGSTIDEMVLNLDIAPTVLNLAGVPIPEYMEGASAVPLLQGREIPWRDEFLYEYYWEHAFPQTPTTLGIRGDRYKYIYYHGVWDTAELYDIQNDPWEQHNLIDHPDHQDRATAMRNRLFDMLQETDGMLIPLRRPPGWRADQRRPESTSASTP